MKQVYSIIIERQKKISIMLVLVLILGILPTNITKKAEGKAAEPEYGISNPRMDSDGVTTWDCVYFGNYWQNDTNEDGIADQNDSQEPIKWRVLSIEGDDAFLLADKNLDNQSYNDKATTVKWENCTLRTWLNETFINNAFKDDEQNAIELVNVVNDDNPVYKVGGGINTTDKIYLLSLDEVTNSKYGFMTSYDESETRKAQNTAYVADMPYKNSIYTGDDWWVRTPGQSWKNTAYISYKGAANYGQYFYRYWDGSGIRPVLHLNLSSSVWSKAGTVSSSGESTETNPTATPTQKVNFQIGEDNNSFVHNNYKKNYPGNAEDYYCPEGHNYAVQNIAYIKKLANGNNKEYKSLLQKMDSKWDGSCYGISLAMLLNKNGMADLKDWGVSDFYHVKPYTNVKARAFMNYLYLSQYSSAFGRNRLQGDCTYKLNWLERLAGIEKNGNSLNGFLEKFVNEVKKNQNTSGLPVAFGYGTKSSGHLILATGISHSESGYVIDIYDMNTVSPIQSGGLKKMTVSDDYSSFDYDGLEREYKYLFYIDTQKLLDAHFEDYKNYEKMTRKNNFTENKNSTIYFNEGIEIINEMGKKILCDEEGFAGDMGVMEIFPILSDTAEGDSKEVWGVSVEESDEYRISSTGSEVDVTIYDSNQYVSLEGSNISYAVNDTLKTTIIGNRASYRLSMDSPLDNCDLASVSASSDNAIYHYDKSKIKIESESGLSNVEVSILNGLNVRKENISMTANDIEIYKNANNENQITVKATDVEGNEEKKYIELTTTPDNTSTIQNNTSDNNKKVLTNVEKKKVTKPAVVKSLSVKNKKKKAILSWKKVKDAKGYHIQYALNKKFTKKKKTKLIKKNKITIKNLKKKKTYYFRVRAYKLNGKKKVYGKWSKVKKIKIKK